MKVGIDCRALKNGPPGIATYVANLLKRIPFLDCIDYAIPRNNFLWNQLRVPFAQLARRWSLYHAPAYTAPLVNFCPLVLSVHDVTHLVHEQWYPYRLDSFRKSYYLASLKRADRIIVCSDFSGREILRLFPHLKDRIRRVYHGVSPFFEKDRGLAEKVRRELNLPESFLLHVGDIHTRRNIGEAAAAAEKLKVPLVLVGRILPGGEPFADWPYRFSGLTPTQLKGVYSAAAVFIYPSLYEGFGLPLLEAMACALPVVASNCSCLPEVLGKAGVLVAPEAEELVRGVRRILGNREDYISRGLARAKEFSWQKTAQETVEIYKELAERS